MKKLLLLLLFAPGVMFCHAQENDTITKSVVTDSVVIYPWLEYEVFKHEIVNMPWRKPFMIPGVSKADDEKMIYKKPVREPKGSAISPITLIYNRYNKRERFKRKLGRNRKRFNREMERLGADSLMISE